MSNITFVTSCIYFNPPNEIDDIRSTANQFKEIVETGIHVVLYYSAKYESVVNDVFGNMTGVHLKKMEMETTWIYKQCNDIFGDEPIKLPESRNEIKDNAHFILEGHIKHELMEMTVNENPWNSTHIAWIDFDIHGIFRRKEESLTYLNWMTTLKYVETCLTIPGCWGKQEINDMTCITGRVNWRYCGGYLLGDMDSVLNMCMLYREKMQYFLETWQILPWYFNIWAWMETAYPERWNPIWYRGDHNDNLFLTSADMYTHPVACKEKIEYPYISIDTYYPTSASYLEYEGKHWLNTRYVNYWIYPSGCYHFNSGRLINNKNVLSELDVEDWKPVDYRVVHEEVGLEEKADSFSKGLEDIRIWEHGGEVYYIATSIGYSGVGKSRMICGKYNLTEGRIEEGHVIEPPQDTWCEKNWIPLELVDGKMRFIYKWMPLEVGEVVVNEEGKWKLDIVEKYDNVKNPIFHKVRGSSTFVEEGNMLVGVVHYSEEHSPRHYYHMMVELEKITGRIVRYSLPFCFEKLGIEFCIGFKIRDKKEYMYWISRHDRDPALMVVDKAEIGWM